MLKPQDIVILLKICAMLALNPDALLLQNKMAMYLCMSASEINAGVNRLKLSGLLGRILRERGKQKKEVFVPIKAACEECLISAVKYFIPVQMGEYTRGIATSYAAPIFEKHISVGNDPIPVWPYAEGEQRGLALKPLYHSVPDSLGQYPDRLFYELLVLVDAIRSGRTRERNIAITLLKERIHYE